MGGLRRQQFGYVGGLALALALGLVLSGTQLGRQIDKDAYDWMFRKYQPPDSTSGTFNAQQFLLQHYTEAGTE